MNTWIWILIGWLVFDALVFIWAWWDDFYYSHNVKSTFNKIKEVITEE